MAAISVGAQGMAYKGFDCRITYKYDRIEARVQTAGYRITTVDPNGTEKTQFDWDRSVTTLHRRTSSGVLRSNSANGPVGFCGRRQSTVLNSTRRTLN